MKDKAIEVCKNIQNTLDKFTTSKKIKSKSTAYEDVRVVKSTLVKKRNELMQQYNLTKNDLK